MASQSKVGQSNDPSMITEAAHAGADIPSDTVGAMIDFFGALNKLCEVLPLLKDACDILNRHQCHSRKFEVAFWQENRKLIQAVDVNRALAQRLEELLLKDTCQRPQPNAVKPKMKEEGGFATQWNGTGLPNITVNPDVRETEEARRSDEEETRLETLHKRRQKRNRAKLREFTKALLFSSRQS